MLGNFLQRSKNVRLFPIDEEPVLKSVPYHLMVCVLLLYYEKNVLARFSDSSETAPAPATDAVIQFHNNGRWWSTEVAQATNKI